jgi:signal transduction histidine kinase
VLLGAALAATLFLRGEALSDVGAGTMMIGLAASGIVFVRKSRSLTLAERRAWLLLGVGLILIALGILTIVTVILTTDYDAAFGPPDLLFLLGYGVGMAGLGSLPHARGTPLQRARLLIDGVIGAIALAALFWVFFYSHIAEVLSDAPTWDRIVGSAYPLFDLMLLVTVMIVVVRRSGHRYDPRLAFVGVGVVSQAIADVAFLLNGVGRSFSEASPLFPLHLIAVTCFFSAAVIVDRPIEVREYAHRPATPLWVMVLPYGTAAVMVAVLLIRVRWTSLSSADTVLFLATLIVGLLVIARQGVAIRENRRFVEDQRTSLVASISHELRTPLTAMVGFLELLDSAEIENPAERKEMTAIVTQQATYLSRIVSDLVMLASDNITPMDLDIRPTPVDSLVWDAVNSSKVGVGSVVVKADKGITAYLDRGRMQQALSNYLANADRYGGDRTCILAQADGGDLVIEVHDDGTGVAHKYELLIWEKFERGPNRLNATVPGSGIGLAVVAAIAQAHGGFAGYRRSDLLGGACFWIRLPGRVKTARSGLAPGPARLQVIDGEPGAQTA